MHEITDALLATQRALLDVVTPELRAVVVGIDNNKIEFYIRFYYDGKVSAELIDVWSSAIAEASAGLDPFYGLDEGIERLDFPNKIPVPEGGRFAYSRMEKRQSLRQSRGSRGAT
ncbi:MAG: hypothetical protein JSS61_00305 [Verrucomicrobia bacterium]|nr:hypothetical protein [Verrucomicrobiota bacterium]